MARQSGSAVDIGAVEYQVNNPAPTLTGLALTSVGGGNFTLAINGTGFIAASVAQWKGANFTTTFVNNTKLTVSLSAADLSSAGMASATVVNPSPGGGASNTLTLTIPTSFLVDAMSAIVNSGTNGTVSSLPTMGNESGVSATVTNNGSGQITVTAARFSGNPTGVNIFDVGGGFVDLQVLNAGPTGHGQILLSCEYYGSDRNQPEAVLL